MEVFAPGLRIGKYELVRKLAEGGFGVLYLTRDTELERDLVIKFLLPEHAGNKSVLQRFLSEGRAIAKIVHPGIVTVFETGEISGTRTPADGCAYIIMEYLAGETLADRLKRAGRLTVSLAMELGRQIANALQAVHEQGIAHRDLKPDNIMLVRDASLSVGERAKVLDFGIAKNAASNDRTQDGLVFGTPHYMSPEQARSTTDAGPSSDIYSLGCILFEMLTGRPPFEGSMVQLITSHMLTPAPVPSEVAPGIPPHLDQVLSAMLAKTPDERPSTMKVVETILEERRALDSMARKRTLGGAMLITQAPPVSGPQISPVAALAQLRGVSAPVMGQAQPVMAPPSASQAMPTVAPLVTPPHAWAAQGSTPIPVPPMPPDIVALPPVPPRRDRTLLFALLGVVAVLFAAITALALL